MYCEDCKMEVRVYITHDWMGDPDVVNGMQSIEVWLCTECGGENLSETNKAPIPLETDALPEGRT